jgi:hypothetical protein
MPILMQRGLLTYKAETTYGTAPADPFTAVRTLRDPELTPLEGDDLAQEEVKPWMGNDVTHLINKRVMLNFSVYDGNSGTAGTAPAYGGLFIPCGMNQALVAGTSVTNSLVNTADPASVAMRWHQDGMRHQLTGAFGTATWRRTAGAFPVIDFQFQGLYTPPTDTAFPTPITWANQRDPLEVSAAHTPVVTINGVARCLAEYEFALNNVISYMNYGGCNEKLMITDRRPTGSIQVEDVAIATQDMHSLITTPTKVPIVVGHTGGPAGSKISLTTTGNTLGKPSYNNRDGVRFITLPFTPTSADGTSEMSLVYT